MGYKNASHQPSPKIQQVVNPRNLRTRIPWITLWPATPGSSLETIMQALAQSNSPSLPQRPTCLVWYAGDSCDGLMQQYNETVLEHQQKDWETSVATPLRKQIADQQRQLAEQRNQIKTLQLAIESQTAATLHSRARNRAGIELLGAILGMGLALFVALATFRRLVRNSIPVNFGQHASGNWDQVVPAGSE